jgi:hypothetical protein
VFTHLTTIKPYNIDTIQNELGRFYVTPEGNHYPSITTILGAGEKPWLQEWRESMGEERAAKETKRAADRGTAVHEMVEKHLNNNPDPTAGHLPEHASEFRTLRLPLRKVNNILTQESALWSNTMKVAGRVDCIGEWDGKLSLIDFKTSTSEKRDDQIQDYYLQTTAYALMFQELYDIQIDNIVILMSVERGPVPLIFQQPIEPYIEPLVKRINKYHTTYGATHG